MAGRRGVRVGGRLDPHDWSPPTVHSPRALVADRLVRKLPAPRTRRDTGAPAAPLAECDDCRDSLPRGQQTGIYAICAGAAASPVAEAVPVMTTVSDRVALYGRRSALGQPRPQSRLDLPARLRGGREPAIQAMRVPGCATLPCRPLSD